MYNCALGYLNLWRESFDGAAASNWIKLYLGLGIWLSGRTSTSTQEATASIPRPQQQQQQTIFCTQMC